ncbi:MAG: hypothetical protein ABI678_12350 [Kofleriaceae bacterium]
MRQQLLSEWTRDADPRAELLDLELNGFLEVYRGVDIGGRGGDMLEQAARLLYKVGESEFAGPIAALTNQFSFGLGLVAQVGVTAVEFAEIAHRYTCAAPLIRLGIDAPEDARTFIDRPELGQMIYLSLHGRGRDDALAASIAASPYVRELRTITIQDGQLTHRGLEALINSPNLPNLISLEVTGNPCQTEVNEVDGRYFWIGAAGNTYWKQAFHDQLLSSAAWSAAALVWPPVFDTYAWTD